RKRTASGSDKLSFSSGSESERNVETTNDNENQNKDGILVDGGSEPMNGAHATLVGRAAEIDEAEAAAGGGI
ncbi:MAG TPA: hypothetical protein V6C97_32780, partial [Oculatellaceae cyanobacterium]